MILQRTFLLFFVKYCFCTNQTAFTLNGKKSLHVVSDKFLSVSIDPAILMSGLNFSGASVSLASHLNPAYVRIAGPSTEFLQFAEDEEVSKHETSEDTVSLEISPSQWESVNEWLITADLIPIFAVNDRDVSGKFDPKTIFLLLGLSDKINASCFWQLGYDSSKKMPAQYYEELNSFRHILNAFPDKIKNWKIIGSDISSWQNPENFEDVNKVVDTLVGVVHSIMWERSQDEKSFPEDDNMTKLLSASTKSKVPIWTTVPKSNHPVSLSSGILWAKQIGDAANKGFDVVFRQPRLYEFFRDTPIYWVTVLHKKLMGKTILDVKPNEVQNTHAHVYAHCTKKQNSFSRRGAVTIFIVNNASQEHAVDLKLIGATPLKNIEVQSYIITSSDANSADTYLNGQKLTPALFQENNTIFVPKIRRARINKFLSLAVPPKSISFFVLPDARVPVCINREDETNLLIEEIRADQNIDFPNFSHEQPMKIFSRIGEEDVHPITLSELYSTMQKELDADEIYYNTISKTSGQVYHWKQMLLDTFAKTKLPLSLKVDVHKTFVTADDNKKKNEVLGKKQTFLRKLTENSRLFRKEENQSDLANTSPIHVHDEKKLNKSDESINITTDELEEIIIQATKMMNTDESDVEKNKRESKGGGRGGGHGRGGGGSSKGGQKQTAFTPKPKRAINMKLLRQKAEVEEKSGTMSNSGTFYKQSEKIETDPNKSMFKLYNDKIKLDLNKLLHPDKTKNEKKPVPLKLNSESLQGVEEEYLDDSAGLDSVGDDDDDDSDISNYHGFHEKFGDEFKIGKPTRKNVHDELWEANFYDKGVHDRKLHDDVNVLLDKEFVINNKDDEAVKKTIKNLENYFNRAQNLKFNNQEDKSSFEDDYDDIDDVNYEKFPLRFKREGKQYTEQDIRYYRQLMNSNIKHMRDSMRKQKTGHKLRTDVSPVQKIKLKYTIDNKAPNPLLSPNPYPQKKLRTDSEYHTPESSDLSPTLRTNGTHRIAGNIRYLKSRLAQHKMYEDLQRKPAVNYKEPEANEETRRLINLIKTELKKRKPRSIDVVNEPSLSNTVCKRYEFKQRKNFAWENENPFISEAVISDLAPITNKVERKLRCKRYIEDNTIDNSNDIEENSYYTMSNEELDDLETTTLDTRCYNNLENTTVVSAVNTSQPSQYMIKIKHEERNFVEEIYEFLSNFLNTLYQKISTVM